MCSTERRAVTLSLALALLALTADVSTAQEGGRRGGRGFGRFFTIPKVSLARVDEVREELKLTDDQNDQIDELNSELYDEMGAVFQDSQGDREKMREGIAKVQRDVNEKLGKILDADKIKRLQEVFIQVNGPAALQDEDVAKALAITDEQAEKLQQVRDDSRDEFMNAGLGDLDDDARAKKVEELTKSRDEKAMAVLTDEQRADFDEMKGVALEIDPENLPRFGRGGGQRQRDTT
jgi:Spy/CpxP family protein refolding chaperone